MSLQSRLDEELKEAMRTGDKLRRSVIRYLRSEIHNQEITNQTTLDDQDVLKVLTHQARQHRESIEAYSQGNRQDLVNKEEAELAIILEYLPEQMSREDIAILVNEAIGTLKATDIGDIGKVMQRVMPQVRGKAEGRDVNTIALDLLRKTSD